MAKKNKLPAEERRRLREQRERAERLRQEREMAEHAKWLEQFSDFGLSTDEEIYNLLFGENDFCEELGEETVENGFHADVPWSDKEDGIPEYLRVFKCKEKYIVFIDGECHNGDGWDLPIQEAVSLFDTLEEAREFRDGLPEGEPYLRNQVMACKEELGDPAYWIKAESGGWPGQHNFAIFYDHDLIMENLRSLDDTEYIKAVVQKYMDFKKSLEERGVSLDSIEKPPREWNCNARYYEYEIEYKGEWFTLSAEIFGRYQHKERETVDFFPQEKLRQFMAEVDAGDSYPGRTKKEKEELMKEQKEFEDRLEASYQGIPHGDGIEAIRLDSKQKESLRKYLDTHYEYGMCDGTPKNTVQWVIDNIEEPHRAGVLEFLRNEGGYCDCEVIMNYIYP